MSRFQDPYLAESAGFATGHSNGIAQGVGIGRQQGYSTGRSEGYTQGWNAAADEANAKIAQKDKTIAELNQKLHRNYHLMTKEIEKLTAERDSLSLEIFALVDRIKILHEKNSEFSDDQQKTKSAHELAIQNLQATREQEHIAFLGAISIARAAMKVVSTVSIKQQSAFITHYADLAVDLQTKEYINKNLFPHNQPLINPHIRDITQILKEMLPKVKTYREDSDNESTES